MATLTIRQLDDAVYDRLKVEARANKRSLEAEARYRLEHGTLLQRPIGGLADRFRQSMIDPGADYEGSVALIRAIREE